MRRCSDSFHPRQRIDVFSALVAGQQAATKQADSVGRTTLTTLDITYGIDATLRVLPMSIPDHLSLSLRRTLEHVRFGPGTMQTLPYQRVGRLLAMPEIARLGRTRETGRFYFQQTCQQNHCVIKPRRVPGGNFYASLLTTFRLYHNGWRMARAEARILEEIIASQIAALDRAGDYFLEQRPRLSPQPVSRGTVREPMTSNA